MPELPEVETAARQLREWAQGRRLTGARAEKTRVVRGGPDAQPLAPLVGHRLLSIERLGKWMLLSFDRGAGLLSHLGMTGKWLRRGRNDAPASHTRASLEFEGGVVLDYRDPRLFGRLLAGSTEELRRLPTLASLGPDPLSGIDVRAFAATLARTSRSIKEALMDQQTLAGLGNIQVSESLFRALLHPERPAQSLSREEVERLARAIDASLRFTLAHEKGDDPIAYVEEGGANFFLVYGHAGAPCPTCQTPIERIVQGGRSTFFCPRCQPAATPRRRKSPPPARPPAAKSPARRAAPKSSPKSSMKSSPKKSPAPAKTVLKRRAAKPRAAARSSARGK